MVFESLAVNVLNSVLGEYVENLDRSQLKIGLWSGDLVLNDLLLRTSIFSELDIPLDIVVGKIGTLILKVPWNKLYTAPVEITIKDVLLLTVPSSKVKKGKSKSKEQLALQQQQQQKKEGDDSFTEKLVAQIVRNVQVHVENVHIRCEDNPTGFGVTLKQISFHTTGKDWARTILTENLLTFNKMAEVVEFSIYWIPGGFQINDGKRSTLEMSGALRDFIDDPWKTKYSVLGPISTKAKLTLTPSPEKLDVPYSHPAQIIDIEMPDLTFSISKQQCNDMAKFGERLSKVYADQLTNRKALEEKETEEKEEGIAVAKAIAKTEQQVPQAQQAGGWFSGWGSWLMGATPAEVEEEVDDALIEEEKEKFYAAIDYQEDGTKEIEYPDEYEKLVANFRLGRVEVNLMESTEKEKILGLSLNEFSTALKLIPAKERVKVSVTLKEIHAVGTSAGSQQPGPQILSSDSDGDSITLFSIHYEKNPIDNPAKHKVIVRGKAIQAIYDKDTVSNLICFASLPADVNVSKIISDSAEIITKWQADSKASIQSVLDSKEEISLDISLVGPSFVLPKYGMLEGASSALLINTGDLTILSRPRDQLSSGKDLSSSQDIEYLRKVFCDAYQIKLQNFQADVKLLNMESLSSRDSFAILNPFVRLASFEVAVERSLFPEDIRLPRATLVASLPSLCVEVTENKLTELLKILSTFPVPEAPSKETNPDLEESQDENNSNLPSPTSTNFTEISVAFDVNELLFKFTPEEERSSIQVITAQLNRFSVVLQKRTTDSHIDTEIGNVCIFSESGNQSGKMYLLQTPSSLEQRLLKASVDMITAPTSRGTEHAHQSVTVQLSSVNFNLQSEQLRLLHNIAQRISSKTLASPKKVSQLSSPLSKPEIRKLESPSNQRNSNEILLQFHGKMDAIKVLIATSKRNLAEINFSAMDLSITQKRDVTGYTFRLTNFEISNSIENSIYKKVCKVDGDNALLVELSQHAQGTKTYDLGVKVVVGCLKTVFVRRLVDELLVFSEEMGSSRELMSSASDTVVATAKQSAEKATALKIKFEVDLQAPYIIVPKLGVSTDILVFDMGRLKASNVLEDHEDDDGNVNIVDRISANLDNVQVLRGIYDVGMQDVGNLVQILEPFAFDLEITRILSTCGDASKGKIKIDGTIHLAVFTLSKEDYDFVWKIIFANVSNEETQGRKPDERDSSRSPNSIKSSKVVTLGATASTSTRPSKSLKMQARIVFAGMQFILRRETSEPEDRINVRSSNLVAIMAFRDVAFGAKMYSNNDIEFSTTMNSVSLSCIPHGGSVITEMVSGGVVNNPNANYILQLDGSISESTGIDVDLKAGCLSVVLQVGFLLQIFAFLQPPDWTEKSKSLKNADNDAIDDVQTDSKNFKAKCQFYSLEVFLVETLSCFSPSLTTKAFMLNCDVDINVQNVNGRSNMMGDLKNLKLVSNHYHPCNLELLPFTVISPTSMALVWNKAENGDVSVDVNISTVLIWLNAESLNLFSRIHRSVLQPVDGNQDDEKVKSYVSLWDRMDVSSQNFPFLQSDVIIAEEVTELNTSGLVTSVGKEELIFESKNIVVFLETSGGKNDAPLLLAEMGLDGQVINWSRQMQATGNIRLEAGCFNASYGLWERIIEPVETQGQPGMTGLKPWDVSFTLIDRNKDGTDPAKLTIEAKNNLEVTLTKSGLSVVQDLLDDFSSSGDVSNQSRKDISSYYKVHNDTGMAMVLTLKDVENNTNCWIIPDNEPDTARFKLYHGNCVVLKCAENSSLQTKDYTSLLRQQTGLGDRVLFVEVPDLCFEDYVPMNSMTDRFFPTRSNGGLVCSIKIENGSRIVTFSGTVQILNDLDIPVDMCYADPINNTKTLAGVALPKSKYTLPLSCTNLVDTSLYFAPEGHLLTTEAFKWGSLDKGDTKSKFKAVAHGDGEHYNFYVVGEKHRVVAGSSNRMNLSSRYFKLHIKPLLTIVNHLPTEIGYCLENQAVTKLAGADESLSISQIDNSSNHQGTMSLIIKLPYYDDQSWTGKLVLNSKTADVSHWKFVSEKDSNSVLTLGLHRTNESTFHLFSPFWLINRTGFNLSYKAVAKGGDTVSLLGPTDSKLPVLLCVGHKQTDAFVKVVGQSDWSEKISLDAAGSGGSVSCKSPRQRFDIGVEIKWSSFGLTKYVIFTPRFYVKNRCPFDVNVRSERGSELKVAKNKCEPFWPKTEDYFLSVAVKSNDEVWETPRLPFNVAHSTLLPLANQYGAIQADVSISETNTTVTLDSYSPGQAPGLLINNCESISIEFRQIGTTQTYMLQPGKCKYFAWSDPTGRRILEWWPKSIRYTPEARPTIYQNELNENKDVEFSVDGDSKYHYSVSFLNGLQRCLLFTDDILTVENLKFSNEKAVGEVALSLGGIGLSLVDSHQLQEIFYLSILGSGVKWERSQDSRRYKSVDGELFKNLESAYQIYGGGKQALTRRASIIKFDSGIQVDFSRMQLFSPSPCHIRRVSDPGIWLKYTSFPHSAKVHVKANKLQVDNQLKEAVFDVVVAPVLSSKTQSEIEESKPFLEASVTRKTTINSDIFHYDDFSVLVQEFSLNVDIPFVNATLEFLMSKSKDADKMKKRQTKEIQALCVSLSSFLDSQMTQVSSTKNFYDLLHISPLKMHLSFSLMGSTNVSNELLKPILATLGVTLTEIHDVVFLLSCFEFRHKFISDDQLLTEVVSHYKSQVIRQLYVAVLGLDVIGNPFGLALGVAKGISSFFYEPIQGVAQGRHGIAEGFSLGTKALVEGTVGGAAGSLSKITNTIGTGIAALTFDDDYQKRRRETNKGTGSASDTFARSGAGVAKGFFDGVAGLVSKPIQGTKEEGASGLFKGLLKGTVGLFAKPATGIVDFASGSLSAVKTVTTTEEKAHRVRMPRFVPFDSILPPYSRHEAQGFKLFARLENGRFLKSDHYIAHVDLDPSTILLLTETQLFLLKQDGNASHIQWRYGWNELAGVPQATTNGVSFTLSRPPTNLFVPVENPSVSKWLVNKIREVMYHS